MLSILAKFQGLFQGEKHLIHGCHFPFGHFRCTEILFFKMHETPVSFLVSGVIFRRRATFSNQ